jgi:hypothetical protein
MRSSRIICLLLLHSSLPACAPTSGPALANTEPSRLSAHRRPVVSKDELRSTCTGLAQTIHAEIAQMKELARKAEAEKEGPPSTMLNAWQRAFGGEGNGIPALQAYAKKRERIEEMNAELTARGCKTVDLESELAFPIGPKSR